MRYEIDCEVVTFFLDNPKREAESIRPASFTGTCLTAQQITPMLDAIVAKFRGRSIHSQIGSINVLRAVFAEFKASGSSWPTTSQAWNVFALRFFQFYLTDTYSEATTATRIAQWSTRIITLLTHLKDEEVIPLDVVIPIINKKKIRSLSKNQPLLGQKGKIIAASTEQVQKLLVDISFGMTNADYLDSVEKKCRHLVGVIKDVCLTHWNGLMKDAEVGRELASRVTDADIDVAIADGRYGEMLCIGSIIAPTFIKYASPSHPQGVHWALALVRHTLNASNDIHCVTSAVLRGSPLFNAYALQSRKKRSYTALDSLTSMMPGQWQQLQSQARLYRFAGLLSPLDATAACCLLTIEHPQFTSESLQDAVLLNVRGKPRLLLTDNKERSILCVDKPRAGRLKSVALSKLAQKIVLDIVRSTAPVRDVMKRAGDKAWRYLFLGVGTRKSVHGVLLAVDASTDFMSGACGKINLAGLYPTLGQNGIGRGNFDYRRLRNTMGIIRWFETGSILEMSRKLGNTRKVALENYLPPALLHAWNTRIIRRFQNTLIVLAAHDESYLLEVTDFSNMADLQHFIAQLILDYPGKTTPLADEVQRRLGSASQGESVAATSTPGFLNIRLSPKSLAYLYAYRDLAQRTLSEDELDKVDTLSGLAPRQFTDMAMLLTHAAENKSIHPSLRDCLNVAVLTACHGQALAMQADLDARLAKLTVKRDWADAK